MSQPRKLIVVTNDDGVKSPGLLAAVRVLHNMGDVLVVAPRAQQSSAGRAFYSKTGRASRFKILVEGERIPAYGVDGSPAVSVRHAVMIVADRKPDLLVSGINYGENLASGLTISGTVGAALEAAAMGIPSLSISLETDKEFHTTHSKRVKFDLAAHFTRLIARRVLEAGMPNGVDVLNINVPRDATETTPWRVTRASRQAYFRSTVARGVFTGYDVLVDVDTLERDADIRALYVDHVVSVTPLTYDLTAHVSLRALDRELRSSGV